MLLKSFRSAFNIRLIKKNKNYSVQINIYVPHKGIKQYFYLWIC